MRPDSIAITLLLLVIFGVIGYFGLRLGPQSTVGPRGLGIAVLLGMALIVEVIPQPTVTTVVLLIYGPVTLIAYLVFLWRWRSRHKAMDPSDEDEKRCAG